VSAAASSTSDKESIMSKFDALALAVDQPSRMTILHPATRQPLRNGTGEEAWIDLLSDDSQAAQAYDDRISDIRIQNRQMGSILPTAAETRQMVIGRLAALTVGWHLVALDGSPLDVPFNAANVSELYAVPSMAWLREQVAVHISRRANFTPRSSNNC